MLKLRLVFGVFCIVALSTLFSFVPQPASAKVNEAYIWNSYNMIYGSLGQYKKIFQEDDSLTFNQDASNPFLFTSQVSTEKCKATIKLLLSESNPSLGKISHEGDCPEANKLSSDARIDNISRAFDMARSEEDMIKKKYLEEICSKTPNSENAAIQYAECTKSAEEDYKKEQSRCLNENDYKKHIAKADAYLNCLAEALGVERPKSEEDKKDDKIEPRSCQIPGIGWMICQLVELTSRLADHTFALLQPFLKIEPLKKEIVADNRSSAYSAWENIRNIANILLTIGFLAVIYSHLTGLGIQTYHIKRSLPRIIVATALINMSFFICAALVDVSNIIGKSIQDTTKYFPVLVKSQSEVFTNWEDTATTITGITPTDKEFTERAAGKDPDKQDDKDSEKEKENGDNKQPEEDKKGKDDSYSSDVEDTRMEINGVVVTGAAVLFANLSILVPVMVFALFAMFTALMVLLFRQAIIIILVIISPLAFAAMIIPGTERWYKKWQSTFIQLVMLYPIMAMLYTGSQLAADAIRESAANNGHTLIAIFSLGIQVIPLFATPLMLKFSGSAVNQFTGAIRGMTSNPRKASMDRAKEFRQDRKRLTSARRRQGRIFFGKVQVPGGEKIGQFLPSNIINAYRAGRRFRKSGIENERKQLAYENMEEYLKGIDDEKLIDQMKSDAASDVFDIDTKTVSAEQNVLEQKGVQRSELMQMATTGKDAEGKEISEYRQRAAVKLLVKNPTPSEVHELLVAGGANAVPASVSREIVRGVKKARASEYSFEISQSTLENIHSGEQDMNQAMVAAIESRRLSPANVASQSPETIKRARMSLENGEVSVDAARDFIESAAKGIVSENIGTADPETIEEISLLLDEAARRGDTSFDSIIASMQASSNNDSHKYDALKSFMKARLNPDNTNNPGVVGSFNVEDIVSSNRFQDEMTRTSNSIGDSIFYTAVDAAINGKNYNAYNRSSLEFYGNSITNKLSDITPETADNLKVLLTSIKSNSAHADVNERIYINHLIAHYNSKVAPEYRVY